MAHMGAEQTGLTGLTTSPTNATPIGVHKMRTAVQVLIVEKVASSSMFHNGKEYATPLWGGFEGKTLSFYKVTREVLREVFERDGVKYVPVATLGVALLDIVNIPSGLLILEQVK